MEILLRVLEIKLRHEFGDELQRKALDYSYDNRVSLFSGRKKSSSTGLE